MALELSKPFLTVVDSKSDEVVVKKTLRKGKGNKYQ